MNAQRVSPYHYSCLVTAQYNNADEETCLLTALFSDVVKETCFRRDSSVTFRGAKRSNNFQHECDKTKYANVFASY